MQVRAALVSEGKSDQGLVHILKLLCRREGVDVEIQQTHEQRELFAPGKKVYAKVQTLVEIDPDYDVLFIHGDADDAGTEARRSGIARACTAARVNCHVPIIPIQETEAWLLTNEMAIRDVVRNPKGQKPLDLPKLREIERTSRPKERLFAALENARSDGAQRHKLVPLAKFRAQLLENLDIDGHVTQLSAWQALLQDTRTALSAIAAPRA
jgi:hypothetical protein